VSAEPEILIACPNMSLDATIEVDELAVGRVHRSTESDARAGGKGVNVARALACVGTDAGVVGFLAGHTGKAVRDMLEEEGIAGTFVVVEGETRSCLTVIAGEQVTVFNGQGPVIDDDWTRFAETVIERLPSATIFVCSGSWPPGAPADAAAHLIARAREYGCTTVCDTSRVYLEKALDAEPDLITPNLAEAKAVLEGKDLEEVDSGPGVLNQACEASSALVRLGPRAAIVTAGSAGAALSDGRRTMTLRAPSVAVRNPVGAGDCLVAGMTDALIRGEPIEEAFRRGVAVAGAGCETFSAGVLDPTRAAQLLEQGSKGRL
jgi:1-phosphofructokinase family hexose kinase